MVQIKKHVLDIGNNTLNAEIGSESDVLELQLNGGQVQLAILDNSTNPSETLSAVLMRESETPPEEYFFKGSVLPGWSKEKLYCFVKIV